MGKYLLFGGQYEKQGGWSDFSASFDSTEKCRAHAEHDLFHWYQIINTTIGVMVDSKYDIKR